MAEGPLCPSCEHEQRQHKWGVGGCVAIIGWGGDDNQDDVYCPCEQLFAAPE